MHNKDGLVYDEVLVSALESISPPVWERDYLLARALAEVRREFWSRVPAGDRRGPRRRVARFDDTLSFVTHRIGRPNITTLSDRLLVGENVTAECDLIWLEDAKISWQKLASCLRTDRTGAVCLIASRDLDGLRTALPRSHCAKTVTAAPSEIGVAPELSLVEPEKLCGARRKTDRPNSIFLRRESVSEWAESICKLVTVKEYEERDHATRALFAQKED